MSRHNTYRQPWLHRASYDGVFILMPAFIALIIVPFLPAAYTTGTTMPLAAWVILVLCIDVAHVYSTIFRTYWDKQRMAEHKTLYLAIPALCYVTGVLLYSIDGLMFWRALAYLAVFHFIRQQYGFMRLYARYEQKGNWMETTDTIAIYSATLYPLIYWHCTPGRNFNWFVEGDFILGGASPVADILWPLYVLSIVAYVVKEIILFRQQGNINIPRNVIIAGTYLSWYAGIIYFNGDLAFTLLNVVAHGIPYMALIWILRQKETTAAKTESSYTVRNTLIFFVLSLLVFAYIEEGLWDGLVWREHGSVFGLFRALPAISQKELLAFLVPLLSLPQSTHYVLDGFIWKRKDKLPQ